MQMVDKVGFFHMMKAEQPAKEVFRMKKLICVFLVLGLIFPASFLLTDGTAKAASSNGITTAMIQAICSQYNYKDRSTYWVYNETKDKPNHPKLPDDWYMGSTDSSYHTSYQIGSGKTLSYRVGSLYECAGFASFIGWKLTGSKPKTGAIESGTGLGSGWASYTVSQINSSGGVQPGDIIRANGHSAVVYSVNSNGSFTVAECWGTVKNTISIGHGFNGNGSSTQLSSLSNVKYILRYGNYVGPAVSIQSTLALEMGQRAQLSASGSYTSLTWTTGDDTVVMVDSSGTVYGVKPGSAVITVTTDANASASCTVTVHAPVVFDYSCANSANVDVYLSSDSKRAAILEANVTSSGYYIFQSSNSQDTYGYIYDASWSRIAYDDDSGDNSNFYMRAYLSAGCTYYLVGRFYSVATNGTLWLDFHKDEVPITVPETMTVPLGSGVVLDVSMGSATSLNWTSSDTSVVRVTNDGYVYGVLPGTAVVTVSDAGSSTNSATCTVTVPIPYSPADGWVTVQARTYYAANSPGGAGKVATIYGFVPQRTAHYTFYTDGSCDTFGALFDANWNVIETNDDYDGDRDFHITQLLQEGQDYFILIRGYNPYNSFDTCFCAQYLPYYAMEADGMYGHDIAVANMWAVSTFTPLVSGEYAFFSTGSADTRGFIRSAGDEPLAEDDDSGDGYNFCVRYWMEAGQTYYLGCRFYDTSATGNLICGVSPFRPAAYLSSGFCELAPGGTGRLSCYAIDENDEFATLQDFWCEELDNETCTVYSDGSVVAKSSGITFATAHSFENADLTCQVPIYIHDEISYSYSYAVNEDGTLELSFYGIENNVDTLDGFILYVESESEDCRFGVIEAYMPGYDRSYSVNLDYEDDTFQAFRIEGAVPDAGVRADQTVTFRLRPYDYDNLWGTTHTYNFSFLPEKLGYVAEAGALHFEQDITFAARPAIVASGTYGSLTWSLDSIGRMTVSGTGAMAESGSDSYPWSDYRSSIRTLTIGEGVTGIAEYSFGWCFNLEQVQLPVSLQTIGSDAFFNDLSLTYIYIPKNVRTIGTSAFGYGGFWWIDVDPQNSYFTSVDGVLFSKDMTKLLSYPTQQTGSYAVPASVRTICNSAFYGCRLSSISIPSGVTAIEINAFCSMNSLTDISIPATVTSISGWAFQGCSGLLSITVDGGNPNYRSIDGVLYTKDGATLLRYPSGRSDTAFTVPQGVRTIGEMAFNSAGNLASITLPDGLTAIRSDAFMYCGALTSLVIPESVTQLDNSLFYSCNQLTSVTILARVDAIYGSTLCSCPSLTSIALPDSITVIYPYAITDCPNLSSVTFMGSQDEWNAITIHEGNGDLLSANIDFVYKAAGVCGGDLRWKLDWADNLFISGTGAMDDFSAGGPWGTGIISVTIDEGVTSVGGKAFFQCAALTNIHIPASVTSIGDDAFRYCSGLTAFTAASGSTAYSASNGVLYNKNKTVLVHYPDAKASTSFTIPSTVRTIASSAFDDCAKLKTVTIPYGVTAIENYAFVYCTGLQRVTIPGSVTALGNVLFFECTGLEEVILSEGVTAVGTRTFANCTALTYAEIPQSVTTIAATAFSGSADVRIGCFFDSAAHAYAKTKSLPRVFLDTAFPAPDFTLPGMTETIESEAFAGIAARLVKLPETVTSIQANAFAGCPNLAAVYIPAHCEIISPSAFAGVADLTIFGPAGSYAEFYANRYGFGFAAVNP